MVTNFIKIGQGVSELQESEHRGLHWLGLSSLQQFSTIFYEWHPSPSCTGACTDVTKIQTQNDFCCFPSV